MLGKTFPIQVDSFHLTSSFISLMISFLRCLYLDPHQIQFSMYTGLLPTEEGLMGKQGSPCSADLLVRLCEVCKQKSLNCNLWFVWKVDCRCISRMTIWSHQVVLPLLVSYLGSCSTCVQQPSAQRVIIVVLYELLLCCLSMYLWFIMRETHLKHHVFLLQLCSQPPHS